MNKNLFFFACVLAVSCIASADISMTYPIESTMANGSSIQAGFVAPGQSFDLVFSNDSGRGTKWDSISVNEQSLSAGWKVVSTQKTDPSLLATIKVPANARPNIYPIKVTLSDSSNPGSSEQIEARVVVRENLVDVSFARKSTGGFQFAGGKVIYASKLTNSSISPIKVRIASNLPSTWFSEETLELKPGTSQDLELVVRPLSSGHFAFAFHAFAGENNLIVKTYSSNLSVRPTLKGKFGSALSGFPFFTFSLLPFQLFDSFFSLVLP